MKRSCFPESRASECCLPRMTKASLYLHSIATSMSYVAFNFNDKLKLYKEALYNKFIETPDFFIFTIPLSKYFVNFFFLILVGKSTPLWDLTDKRDSGQR